MHCRDLNPYVDSALADWRKSHSRHGQLPRCAAGMACGSSSRAAGVSLCPPVSGCRLLALREVDLLLCKGAGLYFCS